MLSEQLLVSFFTFVEGVWGHTWRCSEPIPSSCSGNHVVLGIKHPFSHTQAMHSAHALSPSTSLKSGAQVQ